MSAVSFCTCTQAPTGNYIFVLHEVTESDLLRMWSKFGRFPLGNGEMVRGGQLSDLRWRRVLENISPWKWLNCRKLAEEGWHVKPTILVRNVNLLPMTDGFRCRHPESHMSIGRSRCFGKDLDGRPLAHADWVRQVRRSTSLFCVDFHKAKVVPYAINEVVQAA